MTCTSASPDQRLVMYIDKLGVLDEAQSVVVPLLQALMQRIFVFSHLLEEMLIDGATEGSGHAQQQFGP